MILSKLSVNRATRAIVVGGVLVAALTGCAGGGSATTKTANGIQLSASASEERESKSGSSDGKVCVTEAMLKNTTDSAISVTSAVVYSKKSPDKNLDLTGPGYPSKSSDAEGFNLGSLDAGKSYHFTIAVLCSVKDDSPVLTVNHVDNDANVPTISVDLNL